MVRYKKISIDSLDRGMVVVRTSKPGVKFPYYGMPIKDNIAIRMLQDQGVKHVFIKAVNDKDAITSAKLASQVSVQDKKEGKHLNPNMNNVPVFGDDKNASAGNNAFVVSEAESILAAAAEEMGVSKLPNEDEVDIEWFDEPVAEFNFDFLEDANNIASMIPSLFDLSVDEDEEEAEEAVPAFDDFEFDDDLTAEERHKLNLLAEIQEIHIKAMKEIRSIFSIIRYGGQLELTRIFGIVTELVLVGMENLDVLMNSIRIKYDDDYHFSHSLNVCITSIAIGIKLKMIPRDINRLGIAAILHDIGGVKIPEDVLTKTGPLDKDDKKLFLRHPQMGVQMVKDNKAMKNEMILAIEQHHERCNGTGYPKRLKYDQICRFAHIISVSDVFDAMTSKRPHRKPRTRMETMGYLYKNAGKMFHPEVVKNFFDLICVLPVGSLVKLSDGRKGVVYEPNRTNCKFPKVITYTGSEGERCVPTMINTADFLNNGGVKISSLLKEESEQINPNNVINAYIATRMN